MYKKTFRTCKHCNLEIVSSRHGDHERKCLDLQEKAKQPKKNVGRPKGIDAWNKGLTKDTDGRVRQNSDSVSKTLREKVSNGTYIPRRMCASARQILSEKQSLNNSGGKSKWFDVAGKRVQGTYEKQFAEQMEVESILWKKIKTNNHIFKYIMGGKIRSYAPDFYLSELDLYVEIKGFWWGNDEDKMVAVKEQHSDKRLVVLFGKEKLDEICENIRERLPLEPLWAW